MKDKSRVEDSTANLYDDLWNDLTEDDFRTYRSRFGKIITPSLYSGKVCLDGGCGQGAISSIMSQKAKKLYSVDIGKRALEVTRKRISRISNHSDVVMKKASLLNLPFEDNKFDVVVSNGVIHHTTDPAKAFSELERVLKSNGTLVLGLYGKTGLLRYAIEITSFIFKRVPYKIIKYLMKRAGFTPLFRYYVLDYIYVPMRKRFSLKEITCMMGNFSDITVKSDYPEGRINKLIYGTNYFYITGKKR
jgi:ubiquinone/menaquinone biosynthesis C-methylase UbiE